MQELAIEKAKHTEVTYEEVQAFLKNNSLEFKPGQDKVSYPIITRIHRRYQEGARFGEIKVIENDTISDGHHRFVSLSLLGVQVDTIPAGQNNTKKEPFEWAEILLDKEDHDPWTMQRHYEKRYDEG